LAAYDLNGAELWTRRLGSTYRLATVTQGECWLIGRRDVVAITLRGIASHDFEAPLDRREVLGALIRTGDSLLISVYRTKPDRNGALTPRILRTNLDGAVLWSTTLPVGQIAYEGCERIGVATNWEVRPIPPWSPERWLPYGDDQLLQSGKRILASFKEMPRSGIGCRYVLDLQNGALLWTSRPAPIANALPLGDSKFLMGAQGYGAFETHLYEEDRIHLQRWDSHGHYVAMPDGPICCIELDNAMPKPQFIVQLLPDGAVERRSERLEGYYTSKPILAADGRIYFWRAGRVWRWSPVSRLEEVAALGSPDGSYASSLAFCEHRFAFNVRDLDWSSNRRVFSILDL
jgi:outer membrane protein assembly factor BamB